MRPGRDKYFIEMAKLVATRSTCLRRHVGCVLINDHGHVIATGYNGVAAGLPHCNQKSDLRHVSPDYEDIYPYACEGAYAKSGEDLDKCEAIHAEQNALLQCHDAQNIWKAYITHSPCVTCMKLLMNTSVVEIVYNIAYPHREVEKLAEKANITLTEFTEENTETSFLKGL